MDRFLTIDDYPDLNKPGKCAATAKQYAERLQKTLENTNSAK